MNKRPLKNRWTLILRKLKDQKPHGLDRMLISQVKPSRLV